MACDFKIVKVIRSEKHLGKNEVTAPPIKKQNDYGEKILHSCVTLL